MRVLAALVYQVVCIIAGVMMRGATDAADRARYRRDGGRGMSIVTTRKQRRLLDRENDRQPARMTLVPREHWPSVRVPPGTESVWRSRYFLAQLYTHEQTQRLSISRTVLSGDRWGGGIEWDDLMRVKSECGFGARWAVECYPPESEVVNVANMRHLWLLDAPPTFGWKRPVDRGEG